MRLIATQENVERALVARGGEGGNWIVITLQGYTQKESEISRFLLFFPREEQDFASLVVTVQKSDGGLLQGSFQPGHTQRAIVIDGDECAFIRVLAYDRGKVIGSMMCTCDEHGQWEIQYSRNMDLQMQAIDAEDFGRLISQEKKAVVAPLYVPEWCESSVEEYDPEDPFYLNQVYIQRLLCEHLGVSEYECSDCFDDSLTQRLLCFLPSYRQDERDLAKSFLSSRDSRRFLPVKLIISELILRGILPEGLYCVMFVSGADALQKNPAFQIVPVDQQHGDQGVVSTSIESGMAQSELLLKRDIAALKNLARGDLVGVSKPNVIDGRRNHSAGGPFWYYRGEVQHRHRDGTFTVRVVDAARGGIPQTFRFDTTFHAERSSPQSPERYTLIPWSPEIERQIKLQRLSHVCWFMGRLGWEQLSEREIDEALLLTNEVFSRLTEAHRGNWKQCEAGLEEVLRVCEEAVISVGPWRYEVTIMNSAERSGVLQIYEKYDPTPGNLLRQPVAERLFASLEAAVGILAELHDPFPPIPSDAIWRSPFFVPV